ncbi:MAG TPA: ABC transporter permease [Anaerolinea thermolimosa]|uniref:ABC transporter permease n=1 Tax=Anaerolinea thermolimosa TaxID=229919 RepID=A0A3D1JFL3_9CHLR|nr:ABC transporter permease [Anaerolinea thermolimosa]GAP05752.1 ABC-type dipeptide/oligopeptide/nickel transport systems, permease components [Anaerolinea thermolimosa]HCE17302.1 ABC transporter permease [Anaerolinea thermolimosa]
MVNYILRRLGYAVIMIVLVSFVGFCIIKLPPGDFLTQKLEQLRARGDRSAESQIEALRAKYGLDRPFMVQYTTWAVNFLKGDFGESFQYERPVKDLLGERLTMTVVLALATLIITWVLAIPLGVYSAVRQYSLGDQIITTISFIGIGIPGFLLALIILFFAIVVLNQDVLGLFSKEYIDAPWSVGKVIDLLKHLWIPALISAVTGTGGLIRIMRGNLLETMGQPFVEAARARGLRNRDVIWKHAVRVAINPLIVILGSEALPGIIGGNALVSIVLNLPTIGPLFVDSLRRLDMYLAGTCIVFFTILLLVGNLLADLVLAWVDPRIRLE